MRFASEDVGLALLSLLTLAIAAWQTYERLKFPEGIALSEQVVYLATYFKLISVCKACDIVKQ
ncbi:hypothetical protein [Commensalibacter sp. Nvir]|uniref:AAA family ATPase n=1 Tax=Commensalibacter sp. Nvir TaxID=3069817 RepID=UPI0038D25451